MSLQPVLSQFDAKFNLPIDRRLSVANQAELYALTPRYWGMRVYQVDIDKEFQLKQVNQANIDDNLNRVEGTIPPQVATSLVWDNAQPFSIFFSANNIATTLILTDVILKDSQGSNAWVMDAGSYTNLRYVRFIWSDNRQNAIFNIQDNVFWADNSLPYFKNCFITFNTATAPVATINNSPYLFELEYSGMVNKGTIAPFVLWQWSSYISLFLRKWSSIQTWAYELFDVQAGSLSVVCSDGCTVMADTIRGAGTVYMYYDVNASSLASQTNLTGSFQPFLSVSSIAPQTFNSGQWYAQWEVIIYAQNLYRSLSYHQTPNSWLWVPADFNTDIWNWELVGWTKTISEKFLSQTLIANTPYTITLSWTMADREDFHVTVRRNGVVVSVQVNSVGNNSFEFLSSVTATVNVFVTYLSI